MKEAILMNKKFYNIIARQLFEIMTKYRYYLLFLMALGTINVYKGNIDFFIIPLVFFGVVFVFYTTYFFAFAITKKKAFRRHGLVNLARLFEHFIKRTSL